jgi:hypothetical protein
MNNQGWPTRTMAQSEMDNQKGQNGMNKRMSLARRVMPMVVALAALVGMLGMAPAAHADDCAYSADGYTALCPGGSNYVYLYRYYNGQWNQVATAWVGGGFTYLRSGDVTIAQNNANGQMWVSTLMGWVNISGMSAADMSNHVALNAINYTNIRAAQSAIGLTSLPNLWP